ncbi:hypothetical protein J1614_006101 [Plenodomus biglobosus]|nr:hypothetical protein J1614_006101 [Plenodomus biglobosus]
MNAKTLLKGHSSGQAARVLSAGDADQQTHSQPWPAVRAQYLGARYLVPWPSEHWVQVASSSSSSNNNNNRAASVESEESNAMQPPQPQPQHLSKSRQACAWGV